MYRYTAAFPNAGGGDFHWSMMPALVKVQELFDADPALKGTMAVGMVDAENNDVPPPYGTGTKVATLCLYPAGNKVGLYKLNPAGPIACKHLVPTL